MKICITCEFFNTLHYTKSIPVGKSIEFVSFYRVNIVGMPRNRSPCLHRPVNVMVSRII